MKNAFDVVVCRGIRLAVTNVAIMNAAMPGKISPTDERARGGDE
jgi:hypothetical protein